ncbi:hypothetical protein E3N88_32196 [Mikania micrantha]|uniref:Uncharacterized protein n=1 Tax=Mikania micrantha TaxID=192012 RepID=A0A5N6M8A3_9ASTR|nr:hypothetical protein E3N88_32196 [Mikania micrantha]
MDPESVLVKEGGVAQHVEGWRGMHFKWSSMWYNELAEQHWDNITHEMNKAKSASNGDDTHVDEVKVPERSLGHRCSHIRVLAKQSKMSPQTYLPTCMHQQMNFNNNWPKQILLGGTTTHQRNDATTNQQAHVDAKSRP